MCFSDQEKWWIHDKNPRLTRHEGVDFCCYIDQKNEIVWLNEETKVPALYDGQIDAIFDDFLGKSVLVRHASDNRTQFCSIYAHIVPDQALKIGDHITDGQKIGRCSVGKTVPTHLHLSVLWLPVSARAVDWLSLAKLAEYFVDPICYI